MSYLKEKSRLHSLWNIHSRDISPQPFQIVKTPGLRQEYMNDEIGIVQQNPFRLTIPFNMIRASLHFLEAQLDLVCNCLVLRSGCSRTDDKAICK